jgi:hypothetical protein
VNEGQAAEGMSVGDALTVVRSPNGRCRPDLFRYPYQGAPKASAKGWRQPFRCRPGVRVCGLSGLSSGIHLTSRSGSICWRVARGCHPVRLIGLARERKHISPAIPYRTSLAEFTPRAFFVAVCASEARAVNRKSLSAVAAHELEPGLPQVVVRENCKGATGDGVPLLF